MAVTWTETCVGLRQIREGFPFTGCWPIHDLPDSVRCSEDWEYRARITIFGVAWSKPILLNWRVLWVGHVGNLISTALLLVNLRYLKIVLVKSIWRWSSTKSRPNIDNAQLGVKATPHHISNYSKFLTSVHLSLYVIASILCTNFKLFLLLYFCVNIEHFIRLRLVLNT